MIVVFVGVMCVAGLSAGATRDQGELIERTIAVVGGQVITLSDVRTAVALALVDSREMSASFAATQLIERLLILREVQRYAPPEPAAADIDRQFAAVRARFPDQASFDRTLEAGGFSTDRLRNWIRDDLRIAAYLNQRFAAVSVPSDEEVNAYYAAHRDEFERARTTLEQAAPLIRDRVSRERRAALIADWVAELRRRTPVLEFKEISYKFKVQSSKLVFEFSSDEV